MDVSALVSAHSKDKTTDTLGDLGFRQTQARLSEGTKRPTFNRRRFSLPKSGNQSETLR